jgi:hypothetical protein
MVPIIGAENHGKNVPDAPTAAIDKIAIRCLFMI